MQDNLIEKMIAESYKKEDSHITRGRLFQLIEHLTNDFLDNCPKTYPLLMQPHILEGVTGARERERVLRVPGIRPTEISVGQKPSSTDRSQFELWMGNLGMSGGDDASTVAAKLTAITNFFEDPAANLSNASLPQVLSYLMFLNQFVWMIKEFNASVAGFLWEPFLAALFGGKSKQIATSEGDIADIRIWPAGAKKGESISLKILNKAGTVKGSFQDLVKHFADSEGGGSMRYVVVVKEQSAKEKQVSAVTFYEFDITADSFFDWIGTVEYEEVSEVTTQTFTMNKPGRDSGIKLMRGASKLIDHDRIKNLKVPSGDGVWWWIRHARGSRGVQEITWLPLGKLTETGLVDMNSAPAKKTAAAINLQGMPSDGLADPDKTELTADVALYQGGGEGGARVRKKYVKKKGTTEELFGKASAGTNKLWGSIEELGQWAKLRDEGWPRQKLFQAILNGVTLPDGTVLPPAPGIRGEKKETQFHISPKMYMGMAGNSGGVAGKLGTLKITTHKVEEFFKLAAEQMNDDLIIMFNSLASLTDNIGRFFLVDCGGDKCTETDEANRHQAGVAAMEDADQLEKAVVKSITSVE